jgi:hypothetical protein
MAEPQYYTGDEATNAATLVYLQAHTEPATYIA